MQANVSDERVHQSSTTRGAGSRSGRFFAMAITLARKGRYAEAAESLNTALSAGECSDADALDLEARMYAQQGQYLQAESCWHKAKHLNGANTAYDEGLSRLRRTRVSSPRVLALTIGLAALALFGLLLWRAGLSVRGDLAEFQLASQAEDQELAGSIAGLGSRLDDLDSRQASRLDKVATAATIAQQRDALIARIDEHMAVLRTTFEREIGGLATHLAEVEQAQANRIALLEASLADEAKLLTSAEGRLGERIAAGDADLGKRIGQLEASIRRDLSSLPTAGDVGTLSQTIGTLHDALARIAATLTRLQPHSGKDAAGEQENAQGGVPATQPDQHRP